MRSRVSTPILRVLETHLTNVLHEEDLYVFAMLCVIFGLSLLDRTNISIIYIAGANKDLQLNKGRVPSVVVQRLV